MKRQEPVIKDDQHPVSLFETISVSETDRQTNRPPNKSPTSCFVSAESLTFLGLTNLSVI